MKSKNIFGLFLSLSCVLSMASGCSEKEEYDFDGVNGVRIYVDGTLGDISSFNILNTPLGVVGGLNARLTLKSTSAVPEPVTAHIRYDESFVDEYNKANGTEYAVLPSGSVHIEKPELSFGADSIHSDTTSISFDKEAVVGLEDGKSYLVPVVLDKISGGKGLRLARDEEFRVRYFILGYKVSSSLINDSASGVSGTPANTSSFTVIQAEKLDPSKYKDMFSGDYNACWNFTELRIAKASFTLDFGMKMNISAFNFTCLVMSNALVEISEDNVSWMELGNTSEHRTAYDRPTSKWAYVLYAGLPARYMRVTLTLKPESNGWNYSAYGYCGVKQLSVWAER